MGKRTKVCDACIFFRSVNKETSEGECRRYPPDAVGGFSWTDKENWCGEFKAKSTPKKKPAEPGPRDVIDHYRARFFMMFQDQPLVNWGKITNVVKAYFEDRTAEDLKRIIDYFFDDVPEYSQEKNLFTLEHILGQSNKLVARAAKKEKMSGLSTRDGFLLEQAETWGTHPNYTSYLEYVKDLNNPSSFEEWLAEYRV